MRSIWISKNVDKRENEEDKVWTEKQINDQQGQTNSIKSIIIVLATLILLL